MLTLKVTTIGSSTGVILDEAAMTRLGVQPGDTLVLTASPEGGFRIARVSADHERQMRLAAEIMDEDREILAALAR